MENDFDMYEDRLLRQLVSVSKLLCSNDVNDDANKINNNSDGENEKKKKFFDDYLWDFLVSQSSSSSLSKVRMTTTTTNATGKNGSQQQQHEGVIQSDAFVELRCTIQEAKESSDTDTASSPFDLHSTVTQALMMMNDDVDDKDQQSDDDNNLHPYTTLCLLVACYALDCYHDNNNGNKCKRRPKRWQSLIYQTMWLYQRYAMMVPSSQHDEDKENYDDWDDDDVVAVAPPTITTTTNQQKQNVLRNSIIDRIHLWTKYVAPITWRIQKELLLSNSNSSSSNNNNSNKNNANNNDTVMRAAAYAAGIIATTTQLARQLGTHCTNNNNGDGDDDDSIVQKGMGSLLQSLVQVLKPIVDVDDKAASEQQQQGYYSLDEVLWCYPYRLQRRTLSESLSSSSLSASTKRRKKTVTSSNNSSSNNNNFLVALDNWTAIGEEEEDDEDEDEEDSVDNDHHHRHHEVLLNKDMISYMDTAWDLKGIAVLAATSGWIFSSSRPSVWNSSYVWKLWFPYVADLLNNSDDNDNNANNNDQSYQLLGYSLLENLLRSCPDNSIATTSSISTSRTSGRGGRGGGECKQTSPDSPIWTFQLLSNRMAAAANSNAQQQPRQLLSANATTNDSLKKSPDDTTSFLITIKDLPNAAQTFQLMKRLLAKYIPQNQVSLVYRLVTECPHIGLRPKLLDLLRCYINYNGDDQNQEAIQQVWDDIIDTTILKELEGHVVDNDNDDAVGASLSREERGVGSGTAGEDDSGGSSSSAGALSFRDADGIVDSAELYVSALSLLQLWIMIHKVRPRIANLESRLGRILAAVQHSNGKWSNNKVCSFPKEHFRLNLLQATLEQVLNGLADLNDGR